MQRGQNVTANYKVTSDASKSRLESVNVASILTESDCHHAHALAKIKLTAVATEAYVASRIKRVKPC